MAQSTPGNLRQWVLASLTHNPNLSLDVQHLHIYLILQARMVLRSSSRDDQQRTRLSTQASRRLAHRCGARRMLCHAVVETGPGVQTRVKYNTAVDTTPHRELLPFSDKLPTTYQWHHTLLTGTSPCHQWLLQPSWRTSSLLSTVHITLFPHPSPPKHTTPALPVVHVHQ